MLRIRVSFSLDQFIIKSPYSHFPNYVVGFRLIMSVDDLPPRLKGKHGARSRRAIQFRSCLVSINA
jgi:hypothetical protein